MALTDTAQSDRSRAASARKKAGKYLPLALFIMGAFIFAKYFNATSLKDFLEGHAKLGLAACLFAYILLGITLFPSDPITLLVLAWKGPGAAILLATIGNTLAATLEFYIGYSLGDLADFEKRKAKLPFHLGQLPITSPGFLIFTRMLPGFGPKFTSVAAGVYQVPLFTTIWTAMLANLLGAILMVSGGYGLLKLFTNIHF